MYKKGVNQKTVYSEHYVARCMREAVREQGGLAMKNHPLTQRGVPDYLVMLRGCAIFVETKTTGERCTEAQIAFHRRLKELGFETYVLDTRIYNYYDIFYKGYRTYITENEKAE